MFNHSNAHGVTLPDVGFCLHGTKTKKNENKSQSMFEM